MPFRIAVWDDQNLWAAVTAFILPNIPLPPFPVHIPTPLIVSARALPVPGTTTVKEVVLSKIPLNFLPATSPQILLKNPLQDIPTKKMPARLETVRSRSTLAENWLGLGPDITFSTDVDGKDIPLLHLLFFSCDSFDIYKTNYRPGLRKWIEKLTEANEEFLVLFVTQQDLLTEVNKESAKTKAYRKLFEKIRADLIAVIEAPTSMLQVSQGIGARSRTVKDRILRAPVFEQGVNYPIIESSSQPYRGFPANDSSFADLWEQILRRLTECVSHGITSRVAAEIASREAHQSKSARTKYTTVFDSVERLAGSLFRCSLYPETLALYDSMDLRLPGLPTTIKSYRALFNVCGYPTYKTEPILFDLNRKPHLRKEIETDSICLVDFRQYLFARQCQVIDKMSRGDKIATRVLVFVTSFCSDLLVLSESKAVLPDKPSRESCGRFFFVHLLHNLLAKLMNLVVRLDTDDAHTGRVNHNILFVCSQLRLMSLQQFWWLIKYRSKEQWRSLSQFMPVESGDLPNYKEFKVFEAFLTPEILLFFLSDPSIANFISSRMFEETIDLFKTLGFDRSINALIIHHNSIVPVESIPVHLDFETSSSETQINSVIALLDIKATVNQETANPVYKLISAWILARRQVKYMNDFLIMIVDLNKRPRAPDDAVQFVTSLTRSLFRSVSLDSNYTPQKPPLHFPAYSAIPGSPNLSFWIDIVNSNGVSITYTPDGRFNSFGDTNVTVSGPLGEWQTRLSKIGVGLKFPQILPPTKLSGHFGNVKLPSKTPLDLQTGHSSATDDHTAFRGRGSSSVWIVSSGRNTACFAEVLTLKILIESDLPDTLKCRHIWLRLNVAARISKSAAENRQFQSRIGSFTEQGLSSQLVNSTLWIKVSPADIFLLKPGFNYLETYWSPLISGIMSINEIFLVPDLACSFVFYSGYPDSSLSGANQSRGTILIKHINTSSISAKKVPPRASQESILSDSNLRHPDISTGGVPTPQPVDKIISTPRCQAVHSPYRADSPGICIEVESAQALLRSEISLFYPFLYSGWTNYVKIKIGLNHLSRISMSGAKIALNCRVTRKSIKAEILTAHLIAVEIDGKAIPQPLIWHSSNPTINPLSRCIPAHTLDNNQNWLGLPKFEESIVFIVPLEVWPVLTCVQNDETRIHSPTVNNETRRVSDTSDKSSNMLSNSLCRLRKQKTTVARREPSILVPRHVRSPSIRLQGHDSDATPAFFFPNDRDPTPGKLAYLGTPCALDRTPSASVYTNSPAASVSETTYKHERNDSHVGNVKIYIKVKSVACGKISVIPKVLNGLLKKRPVDPLICDIKSVNDMGDFSLTECIERYGSKSEVIFPKISEVLKDSSFVVDHAAQDDFSAVTILNCQIKKTDSDHSQAMYSLILQLNPAAFLLDHYDILVSGLTVSHESGFAVEVIMPPGLDSDSEVHLRPAETLHVVLIVKYESAYHFAQENPLADVVCNLEYRIRPHNLRTKALDPASLADIMDFFTKTRLSKKSWCSSFKFQIDEKPTPLVIARVSTPPEGIVGFPLTMVITVRNLTNCSGKFRYNVCVAFDFEALETNEWQVVRKWRQSKSIWSS